MKQTNFPSTLSEYYYYDADNNLTSKTDRKGQTITYVYDALNRLAKKQYTDSTEVDYTYDLPGTRCAPDTQVRNTKALQIYAWRSFDSDFR